MVRAQDLLDPLARNANLPENAPATDDNRLSPKVGGQPGAPQMRKAEWLVVSGVCTARLYTASQHPDIQNNYGSWLCPAGSQYDTAGRSRRTRRAISTSRL
jgi:ubiquinol-cytochrome c reductase iron-sulfur subunit